MGRNLETLVCLKHGMLLLDREASQRRAATDQCASSVMLPRLSHFLGLDLVSARRLPLEVVSFGAGQPFDLMLCLLESTSSAFKRGMELY